MTLLQKILNDKAIQEMKPKAMSTVEADEAKNAGLKSPTPLRNAAKGSANLTHKNIVKLEKYFGYSLEELVAEYKEPKQ